VAVHSTNSPVYSISWQTTIPSAELQLDYSYSAK